MTVVAQAVDVVKAYHGRAVIDGVSLEARAGEILGLIGPNGGGKSTMLLLLAGLVRPTSGSVTVAGVAAHEVAQELTGRIGLILAQPGLYPLLTGAENMRFFGRLFGLTAAQVEARAEPLLQELRLSADIDRRVSDWSSGMLQKLSLVRAMLLRPQLLLLDEPTANLDPVSAHTLYKAVEQRAREGVAVVIATHDLVAAERLCDRVLCLHHRVIADEPRQGPREVPPPGRLLALLQQAERA